MVCSLKLFPKYDISPIVGHTPYTMNVHTWKYDVGIASIYNTDDQNVSQVPMDKISSQQNW
jgi:hypothetical protein